LNPSGLDGIDLKILELLYEDPRITYAGLATKVELSRDGIKYRIARMEKKGIIAGYSLCLNPKGLGLTTRALLSISFSGMSESLKNSFEAVLGQTGGVLGFYRTAGEYDYIIEVACRSNEGLNGVIQKLKGAFSNQIRSIGVVPIVE
jgi:DNA-binding Lrp family transcriptional regulator